MKKLLWITLGMSLTMPAYAWDSTAEDMKTMNANMSTPVVRVITSYPGMFRGWSDNQGFKTGPVASLSDDHHVKKKKVKHYRKKYHVHHYKHSSSSICIVNCYCKHH